MIKVLENIEDKRDDWLELKKRTIGSSEIPTILGLNPWCSPYQLWMEKTGKLVREENDYMWLGKKLEPVVAQLFEKKTGTAVAKANYMAVKDDVEWASASPDYHLLETGGVLECKNTNHREAKKWEDGNVPDYAHCQLLWQLGVLEIPVGIVACLPANSPDLFAYKQFDFDKDIFDMMLEQASKFIKLVQEDIPPDVTDQDKKIIEQKVKQTLHKERIEQVYDLTPENHKLFYEHQLACKQLAKLKEETKRIEKTQGECRAKIINLLENDANTALLHSEEGCYEISLTKVDRGGYSVNPTSYITYNTRFNGEKI